MEYPKREDLLGYVLGALESEEHQRIEEFVKKKPGIDQELDQLKSQIQPLNVLELDRHNPPVGLARRTVEAVAQIDPQRPIESDLAPRFSRSGDSQLNFAKSWSISDFVMVAVCCGVLAAIIIPTVSHARFESRVLACQNKLRDLGFAMLNYSEITGGDFVPIKNLDKLNVASSYAPTLVDFGLVEDKNIFFCNGIARDREFNPAIPDSLDEVRNASGDELFDMQMRMGGDFGYSLGYVEGKVYRSPRIFNRARHVIMSDQPSYDMPGRVSRNHGGKGQNVLCEDLHIEFISTCSMTPNGDPIYLNRHGMIAAGVDPGDDVIGRGADSPFMRSHTP